MNRILLIGRLAQIPDVRYTREGKALCCFSLAVKNRSKDRPPDYIDCIAWEKLGEICGNYLDKGRQVAVEGSIQMRRYETAAGGRRMALEVVCREVLFLDSPWNREAAGEWTAEHA